MTYIIPIVDHIYISRGYITINLKARLIYFYKKE